MTESIIKLANVEVFTRCPQCGVDGVTRASIMQSEISTNGTALWTLSQACTLCGWSVTQPNVKMGV